MEDRQIIELYFKRDQQAITETERKYGAFCRHIAMNILHVFEDAEECVNDTYYSVWEQIPPVIPDVFRAFLGRVTRNIAISRFRRLHAKKRFHGMEAMLSELNDCIPAPENVEQHIEAIELSGYISDWLDSLPKEDSALFVRRYWFGDEVQALAGECHVTAAKMAHRMFRLRKSLKAFLEKKGVSL